MQTNCCIINNIFKYFVSNYLDIWILNGNFMKYLFNISICFKNAVFSPFPMVAEAIQEELDSYRAQEDEVKKLKAAMVGFRFSFFFLFSNSFILLYLMHLWHLFKVWFCWYLNNCHVCLIDYKKIVLIQWCSFSLVARPGSLLITSYVFFFFKTILKIVLLKQNLIPSLSQSFAFEVPTMVTIHLSYRKFV